MFALFDFLNDFGDEGINVARIVRRNDALVSGHLLVDPAAAGVDDIGADGNVRRDLAPLHGAGLDQQPGRVADGGNDPTRFNEGFDDGEGLVVGAQLVGVITPPGNTRAS